MSLYAALRRGQTIELTRPDNSKTITLHWNRRKLVGMWWSEKILYPICWWNTRQWRVLVTLPCGCQILKNCKQPAACTKCLCRMLFVDRPKEVSST